MDFGNLPYGWCAITSLGPFDPKRGGHLVLWDLQLVIEFPPGSTILIPSAVLQHSNIPIHQNTHVIGSLVDKGSGRTQGATDVWYFVQGLHSIVRLDTLPEKETLSEKQADPKEISHLGCRLCMYVIKCLNAISATDCLTVLA